MQFITNIFTFLTILTKNVNIEKKLLNNLFNFNMKQKKIILSIKYAKKLNYSVPYEKRNLNLFIPYGAFKSLNPYKNNISNDNSKKTESIFLRNNNSFRLKKTPTGNIGQKLNEIKKKIRINDKENNFDKIINDIWKKNRNSIIEQNYNKSK